MADLECGPVPVKVQSPVISSVSLAAVPPLSREVTPPVAELTASGRMVTL
jgi:hypothetical protein